MSYYDLISDNGTYQVFRVNDSGAIFYEVDKDGGLECYKDTLKECEMYME